MTKSQLIKVAKTHLKEFVYFQAKLDNRNVTFPQTELILQNNISSDVDPDDVVMINNLKKAFKYTLENIDNNITLEFVIKLNKVIAIDEALYVGQLRHKTIGIGGVTKKRPPVSKELFLKILDKDFSNINNCVDLFLEMCTLQFFFDGNKRTSSLVLNKLLIENQHGYFSIYSNELNDFSKLLNNYYNEKENAKILIRQFIIEKCIHFKIDELEEEIIDNIEDVGFTI